MKKLTNYAIVTDFDGTITTKDTNDTIFYEYGNEETRAIEDRFVAGEADYKTTMTQHFEAKPLTFEQYYSFLDEYIQIDPGFSAFLQKVRDKGLPFYIVSGGFLQAITHILRDFEIPEENILSNSLIFNERLIPTCAHDIPSCPEDVGPCGNCKKICLEKLKEQTGKKILFIGDGFTDRCAVKLADCVFAKDSLIDYCETHGIKHEKFKSFDDISTALGALDKSLDIWILS